MSSANSPLHDSLAADVVAEMGVEKLREILLEYTKKVEAVAALKDRLEVDGITDADYDTTVNELVRATGEYYKLIGKMPENTRRFLSSLQDSSRALDDDNELSKMLGYELKIPRASVLSAQSIRPQKYTMQIDAITTRLSELHEQSQITVGRKGNQPINTTVTFDIPDHLKIEGGGSLTPYDKSIINGVTSLIESGNTVFSVPMLYHAMTGKPNPTVDDKLSDEISVKLEKMRRTMITIDLSEESDARYITDEDGNRLPIEDLKLEGYLMPLNKIHGKINGKSTELYQILQHPPLYSYSKMKHQIASVPISLLGAPVNNNNTTIPLKTYLLQRIELMKAKKTSDTTILFESIYTELGADSASKTQKMRIRDYTDKILAYYADNNYIQSYETYKNGKNIEGIIVKI